MMLDDEFAMTTTKQQVVPSESIWSKLNDKAKIAENISNMRATYKKETAQIRESAAKKEEAVHHGAGEGPEVQDDQAFEGHPGATRRSRQELRGRGQASRQGIRSLGGQGQGDRPQRRLRTRGRSRQRTCPGRRSSAACSAAASGCCSSTRSTRSTPTSTPAFGSTLALRAAMGSRLSCTLGDAEV